MTTYHDLSHVLSSDILAFDSKLTIDEKNMFLRVLQANPTGLSKLASLLSRDHDSLTTSNQTQNQGNTMAISFKARITPDAPRTIKARRLFELGLLESLLHVDSSSATAHQWKLEELEAAMKALAFNRSGQQANNNTPTEQPLVVLKCATIPSGVSGEDTRVIKDVTGKRWTFTVQNDHATFLNDDTGVGYVAIVTDEDGTPAACIRHDERCKEYFVCDYREPVADSEQGLALAMRAVIRDFVYQSYISYLDTRNRLITVGRTLHSSDVDIDENVFPQLIFAPYNLLK